MNFHEFLQSTYMSTQQSLQAKHNLYDHGKIQATQELINGQRRIYKWWSHIELLFKFVLIKLKLADAPKTIEVLFAEMKQKEEAVKPLALVKHDSN